MKKILLSSLLAICGMSFSQDLNDGLIQYFPFDSDANDHSSNGFIGQVNGTVSSVAGFQGLPNTAYDFENGYVKINDTLTLTIPFTIDFWYYPDTCTEGYCSNKIYTSPYTSNENGTLHIQHTSGRNSVIEPECSLFVYIPQRIDIRLEAHRNQFSVPIQKWNHFTYEFGNNSAKSFVNNSFLNEETGLPNASFKLPDMSFGDATGKIDEFRIYNRILSQEEKTMLADPNRTITAIETTQTSTEKTLLKTYNLQGQEITEDTKGIQIRVFSDGSREKTFVE
jgi:hypothetical protein